MADLKIASPLTLKCGLTIPNRLAKGAMAEHMADDRSLPGSKFLSSYSEWADGGWGMLITGNVHVDPRHMGAPSDITSTGKVGHAEELASWKAWAAASKRNGTPTIIQMCHPGRQSPIGAGSRGIFAKALAPSPIALNFGSGIMAHLMSALMFGTPQEMSIQDIRDIVGKFATTAKLAAEAGFDGVEIHAAHGYLLAQFLSEKSNQRTDEYGGSPAARTKIVVEVINAIRATVPEGFCVGIKLNSADHQSSAVLLECLDQLKLITAAGIDFLEISGGTYENPTMTLGTQSSLKSVSGRTAAREAFFLEFAQHIRSSFPDVPLMVTGGFRTRAAMEAAVRDGDCDIIGIARPAVLNPRLPTNILLNSMVKDEHAKVYARKIPPSWFMSKLGVKAIGAGAENDWYCERIQHIGNQLP